MYAPTEWALAVMAARSWRAELRKATWEMLTSWVRSSMVEDAPG